MTMAAPKWSENITRVAKFELYEMGISTYGTIRLQKLVVYFMALYHGFVIFWM